MRGKIPAARIFLILCYQIIFAGISFFLLKRVGAFGCFDDCFNFGAGDFILQGKQLYSQIFFNHQPFMAYISAAVQYSTDPATLFELVKFHRIAALVFADICGVFLILRFGVPAWASLVVFETTKFYIFGDRFLAEGLIVYPMMYSTMLIVSLLYKKELYHWEYVLAAVCAWFIFWMREPFMPWAIVAYTLLMMFSWKAKNQDCIRGILIFALLHAMTLAVLPLKEYFFNVIAVNFQMEVGVQAWTIDTAAQIIAYPLFAVVSGLGNVFQNVLFILSILFLAFILYETVRNKRFMLVGTVCILLAAANLRVVPVGSLYYDAFHLIPWYGIFLAVTMMCVFASNKGKTERIIRFILFGVWGLFTVYVILSPSSYIHERIDTQTEFNNGYGNYFAKGEVIRLLSAPGDTMFVEMWEDPIYFVAGVPTAYKYSWYTSIMPEFSIYRQARNEMFQMYPPTFYAGACRNGDVESGYLSADVKDLYVQLLNSNKPSCIYVKKSIMQRITDEVSAGIKTYGYTVP